jgi:hypothetical protein
MLDAHQEVKCAMPMHCMQAANPNAAAAKVIQESQMPAGAFAKRIYCIGDMNLTGVKVLPKDVFLADGLSAVETLHALTGKAVSLAGCS